MFVKIVLSRKGFDSANGGCASPIFPDGTLLSMPIPNSHESSSDSCESSRLMYSDLYYDGISYEQIWADLGKKHYQKDSACHLDPDIRPVRQDRLKKWTAAFGQHGAAETHLRNQNIEIGDIFLFFGWFRDVDIVVKGSPHLRYKRNSPQLQVIYGYLQIGSIIRGESICRDFSWHPHADASFQKSDNNTLYVPSRELHLPGIPAGIPGYGTFRFAQDIVLTKPGMSRSCWTLQQWMKTSPITHHSPKSVHSDYFQSAVIGQEFVIGETPELMAWVTEIFTNHQDELKWQEQNI